MIGDAFLPGWMTMTRNRIVEENKLPGAPSTEWDVNGWGDPSIQGFGHDISIDSARPSCSRSGRTPRTTGSTSTAWAGTQDSGRAWSTPSRRRCRFPSPSPRACAIPRRTSTTAGTGPCPRRGRRRRTRSPGSTSRAWCARIRSRSRPPGAPTIRSPHPLPAPRRSRTPTVPSATGGFASRCANRARATSTSSCATTRAAPTSCSRPPTPPGRPTTATADTAPTAASIRSTRACAGGRPAPTR